MHGQNHIKSKYSVALACFLSRQAKDLPAPLYIYCCVYSARLLMIDRETVRNM